MKESRRRRGFVARRTSGRSAEEEKARGFFGGYVYFLEGMADYSQTRHSYGDARDDHRSLGWDIGRQIVALYLVEMLLQIYLRGQGHTRGVATHDLARLFRKLPNDLRDSVEHRYAQILSNEVEWTWDFCRTVESFVDFLGKSPITNTRYPWQQDEGTLFAPDKFRPLIYALYIELHGYPYDPSSMEKRFDTEFRSFDESREIRYDSKGNRISE